MGQPKKASRTRGARRASGERADRSRTHRLEFRVPAATKALLERAARLEQRSLTDFCVPALHEAAREALGRHQELVLSARDREAFFDALVAPPEPDDELVRALSEHRRRVAR
jgi:uncharacterized protein (DUF1778 family)